MMVQISLADVEKVRTEAMKAKAEICGFMIGRVEKAKATVFELKSARNILNSSVRFQIDPMEFLKVLEDAERKGMDVIGFYHSHPSSPYPSEEDRRFMKLWPDKIWLIVSSTTGFLKAFRIEESIEEIDLVVV
jgi:proteasome lid subunit RPN8/RPN11